LDRLLSRGIVDIGVGMGSLLCARKRGAGAMLIIRNSAVRIRYGRELPPVLIRTALLLQVPGLRRAVG